MQRLLGMIAAMLLVASSTLHAQPAPAGDAGAAVDDPGPQAALTQRIAVWRLDALGIDAELVARLETLFRMELDRLATAPLPTRREIERAIARDRDLRECGGEDRCLVGIGKKVGVDVVVTGSVAALGDSYILNIKVVDVATGKQIRRIATEPLRGSPDELIEAVRVAAYRLLAPDQLLGSIAVLTDLVGAEVKLDGKAVGKTPLPGSLGKLALGEHALEVNAAGYSPYTDKVEVRFQKTTRVVVRMVTTDPVDDGTGPIVYRDVRHPAPKPWYASPWFYGGVGVAALVVGLAIGGALAEPDILDCNTNPGACR